MIGALATLASLAPLLLLTPPASAAPAAGPAAADSLLLCDQAHALDGPAASAAVARAILAREPDSAAAAWRLSRALIGAANQQRDRERRRALFGEAMTWALAAVRGAPADPHGHTCLAICAGSLAGLAGGRRGIELADSARVAAERAIALDEDNHLAHLVLGVWHREVATIGGVRRLLAGVLHGGVPAGASLEQSESCLRRAVALAPGHINSHRELGITLLAMRRYEDAVAEFETALALRPTEAGDGGFQEDARRRLGRARRLRDAPPQRTRR